MPALRTALSFSERAQKREREDKLPKDHANNPRNQRPQLLSTEYGETIQIEVGPAGQVFIAHLYHLRRACTLFDGEDLPILDGRTMIVDILPDVFKVYLDWAYTRRFAIRDIAFVQTDVYSVLLGRELEEGDRSREQDTAAIWFHVACYRAAFFFLDEELQRRVLDSLRQILIEGQGLESSMVYHSRIVEEVWSKCARDCGLQRLLIDMYTMRLDADDTTRHILECHHKDFVVDFAARLLHPLPNGYQYACYYHDTCAA